MSGTGICAHTGIDRGRESPCTAGWREKLEDPAYDDVVICISSRRYVADMPVMMMAEGCARRPCGLMTAFAGNIQPSASSGTLSAAAFFHDREAAHILRQESAVQVRAIRKTASFSHGSGVIFVPVWCQAMVRGSYPSETGQVIQSWSPELSVPVKDRRDGLFPCRLQSRSRIPIPQNLLCAPHLDYPVVCRC